MALLLLLIAFQLLSQALAIEGPCSACRAIATELQKRLDAEKERGPRNHLDLRHRLDNSGKRYGKVIAYEVSELRAYELLEDLCKELADYSLAQINDSENGRRYQRWARRLGTGREIFHSSAWPPSDEIKARAKQLEAYCGNVLSQHEDALTAALLGGDTGAAASIDEYICGTLVKACPAAMYQQSASEEEAKQLAIEVYAEQGALPPEPEAEAEDESDEEGAGEPANSPGSEATADEAVTVVDAGSMAAAASGSSGPAHEEF